jgi:hypothetical protein
VIRSSNTSGRVNLAKYVNLGSGKWRFCPAAQSPNGRVRPDYVIVEGKPELHKEGAYYIDWYQNGKRRRESVGKNAADAFATAERQTQLLKNEALGIHVVPADKKGSVTLEAGQRKVLSRRSAPHRFQFRDDCWGKRRTKRRPAAGRCGRTH